MDKTYEELMNADFDELDEEEKVEKIEEMKKKGMTTEQILQASQTGANVLGTVSGWFGKKNPPQEGMTAEQLAMIMSANQTKKKGLSGGAIAGIVIGSVGVIGLVTYLIVKSRK